MKHTDLFGLLDHQAFGIMPDGRVLKFACEHGPHFSFKELQRAIDGFVTLMPMPGITDYVMVVDEDGLPRGLADNPVASALAQQRVVGVAVVMTKAGFRKAK